MDPHEWMDLPSDDDLRALGGFDFGEFLEPYPAPAPAQDDLYPFGQNGDHDWQEGLLDDGTLPEFVPDGEIQPDRVLIANAVPAGPYVDLTQDELITPAACLQMVTSVLPEISANYVLQRIGEQTQDQTLTLATCERIITKLLDDGAYPKEEDEDNNRKRKRENSHSEFENDNGQDLYPNYRLDAIALLKDEFVDVPVRHIEAVLREHNTFFKSYIIIESQLRNYTNLTPFKKVIRPRIKRGIELGLVQIGSRIPKELHAAKAKCEEEAAKRHKAEEAYREEENNIRIAVLKGEMTDCQCCFDEFPLNRMIRCGGITVHLFCSTCMKNYVGSEIGSSRCRPVCFADADCGGGFARKQLQECLDQPTFDRLEHMQQQEDLAIAGLDLDECPFCDFKAEYPPVEQDREFRCLNPKCRKTSCRLCQKETHIPKSCEEAKKDQKITVRHIVEEAMTAALIRNCNKCKHPFIKDTGCNKMSCSHCRNVQCYVCSKDVKDYAHFDNRTGCPLHDNVEQRHEKEVKKAADEAMSRVKADNPDVSEADLMIQVSARVKQAELRRLGLAQEAHHRFPHRMVNGVLVDGPAPQAPPLAPVQQQGYVPLPPYIHPQPQPRPQPQIPFPAQQPIQYPPFVPLQHVAPHQLLPPRAQIFVHQPHVFQPPVHFPQPPNPMPAQMPPVGVAQHQQVPHPQAQYVDDRFFAHHPFIHDEEPN
ncbi:hypothetical protein N0V90_003956 [Kalmusia sp. IMI 367209]|nr:hypothetical protein N0V90_003956 [Kalmusia sp. IMI 367209]